MSRSTKGGSAWPPPSPPSVLRAHPAPLAGAGGAHGASAFIFNILSFPAPSPFWPSRGQETTGGRFISLRAGRGVVRCCMEMEMDFLLE